MPTPAGQPKRSPRAAASYRANKRSIRQDRRPACPLPVIALARPPKSGKAWPNKLNPVLGKRECVRRLRQMGVAL